MAAEHEIADRRSETVRHRARQRSAAGDVAPQAARARTALARLRPGLVAQRDCPVDGAAHRQRQAAAVSRPAAARSAARRPRARNPKGPRRETPVPVRAGAPRCRRRAAVAESRRCAASRARRPLRAVFGRRGDRRRVLRRSRLCAGRSRGAAVQRGMVAGADPGAGRGGARGRAPAADLPGARHGRRRHRRRSPWRRRRPAGFAARSRRSAPRSSGRFRAISSFSWILSAAAYTTLPLLAVGVSVVLAPVVVYLALDE